MTRIRLLVLAISFFAVSCVGLHGLLHTIAVIDQNSPLPNESETIVVIGVTPANYHVHFYSGEPSDGQLRLGLSAVLAGMPRDGYVVGKVAAGNLYALVGARYIGDMPGPSFFACGNGEARTFTAPSGKVVYIGSVDFTPNAGRLAVKFTRDLNAAQTYVAKAFPNLAGRVESALTTAMKTNTPCK